MACASSGGEKGGKKKKLTTRAARALVYTGGTPKEGQVAALPPRRSRR